MRQFFIGTLCGAVLATATLLIVDGNDRKPPSEPKITSEQEESTGIKQNELTKPTPLHAQQVVAQESAKVLSSPSDNSNTHTQNIDVLSSIKLSADHAKILRPEKKEGRPLTLPELHMQLTTESKDANWASDMEQSLSQFLSQNNTTGEFEVLSIECRSTLCEILAYGNLPTSPQRWNILGEEMNKQSWWSSFNGNWTSSSGKNGRTTIVTILQRK